MTEETPEAGSERRRAERRATDAKAHLTLRNGIVIEAVFLDLSRSGGRLRAGPDLPDLARFTTVHVKFGDLNMKARVIWQKRSRDGTSELGLEAL